MNKLTNKYIAIIITAIFFISLIISPIILYSATEYKREVYKWGGNGQWWNPFDSGFQSVSINTYIYEENGVTIYKTKVECYGNGSQSCPDLVVGQVSPTPEWAPDDEYLEESFEMMQQYVATQANNSIFNGNATFNEIIDNIQIYRNVLWTGDSTGVNIEMNIFAN